MRAGLSPSGARRSGSSAALRERILDGALDWISGRLDLFDPFAGNPNGAPDRSRTKAALELAMMCMLACEGGLVDVRIKACLDMLQDAWDRPGLKDLLVRSPGRIRLYGMFLVALQRCGRVPDGDLISLQRLVDGRHACAVEEVPFRVMDLRYLLDLAGIPNDLPSVSHTFTSTTLARSNAIGDWTRFDIYAATHTVFYLTDFGLTPYHFADEELVDRVGLLLGAVAIERDWDLTGELLLSCDCLRVHPFSYAAALEAFAEAQRDNGCIPATSRNEDQSTREDDFEQNYHTTLVGALMVSAAHRAQASMERTGP
ncbi:MAG: DUF6895 family protein [Solirubrobacteraceae bacterium]